MKNRLTHEEWLVNLFKFNDISLSDAQQVCRILGLSLKIEFINKEGK